jgi:hypothetical protein
MKNFGPALCGIGLESNILANSKQNLKIFVGVIDWRKNEGRKSRDTVSLNVFETHFVVQFEKHLFMVQSLHERFNEEGVEANKTRLIGKGE